MKATNIYDRYLLAIDEAERKVSIVKLNLQETERKLYEIVELAIR